METTRGPDGGIVVALSGELVRGDDERFATLAGGVVGDATVALSSPGGNLVTGLRIGSAIRMRGWRTTVPDGSTCASACGLAWLGGYQRAVGQRARVGFHAAYIENADGTKREVGSGNALVGSYLGRLGLTDAAVLYLTSAPPEGAAWLTEAVAREVGIRVEFATLSASMPALGAGPRPPDQRPPASPTPAQAGGDGPLLKQLYSGFPSSVRTKDGESCANRECRIRLLGADTWTGPDGLDRRTIVAVAEVKGDCHACAAILGLAQFRRTSAGDPWQAEILAPAASRIGGYGVFGGKLAFHDGGAAGRVAVLEEAGGGQGVFGATALFWMSSGGAFKEALRVQLWLNVNGTCDDKEAECRRKMANENYESSIRVSAAADGLVHVDQSFVSAVAIPPASWTIDPGGRARQTAGGRWGPEATAQDRATQESAAFMQGRADRVALDAWFGGLPDEQRAGADSWAGRRSLRTPGNCEAPPGKAADWAAGCGSARQRLGPFDARRRTDPDYRRGWNSL